MLHFRPSFVPARLSQVSYEHASMLPFTCSGAVQDCFFLPQKAYMPLGSLRQQLLFPQQEVGEHVESDVALKKLAEEAWLHSVPLPALSSFHIQVHVSATHITACEVKHFAACFESDAEASWGRGAQRYFNHATEHKCCP
jgi:hypothetical protein